jgi:hypothetical protein
MTNVFIPFLLDNTKNSSILEATTKKPDATNIILFKNSSWICRICLYLGYLFNSFSPISANNHWQLF